MQARTSLLPLWIVLGPGCEGAPGPGDTDPGSDTAADTATDTAADTGSAGDSDTAVYAPPHFLAAYGNGATIDVLELDASSGSVGNLGEWPDIVAYNGFPAVLGDRLVLLGVETPQTIDFPWLYSLDPRDFSIVAHPPLSDPRVADLIPYNGELYGVIGNGVGIEIASLSLTSGAVAMVGTVADMAIYFPRPAVFATEVCALGETPSSPGVQAIFCFDPADPASATSAPLSGLAHAIYAVEGRLLAVRGTGTQIEIHEITPATGMMTLLGTVPNLYEMYVPTPSAVGTDLYALGRSAVGAPIALYRIPVNDVAATSSIPVDQDLGDLMAYGY